MGNQGGITWEPQGNDRVVVRFWKVVPAEKAEALVRDLHALGRRFVTLPPVKFTTNNRSFGRLPPGAYPRWQSREWIGFALWLILVVGLLLGAVYRNASSFF
jgi:hypothetical protein